MSRFTSLLKMFGLESRLLMNFCCNAIQNIDFADIDWTEVNNILDIERNKAISFLKSNLN